MSRDRPNEPPPTQPHRPIPPFAPAQVSNPESYAFDLPVLVGEVLGLLLSLGRSERFVRAVVAEPDYSEEVRAGAVGAV